MTNLNQPAQATQAPPAPQPPPTAASPVETFGKKIISDDFAGAQEHLKAQMNGPASEAKDALLGRLADILVIEIETRLESGDIEAAKKCLGLLHTCAPEREEEAGVWFGDYYMAKLDAALTAGGIASFGADLDQLLKFDPQREEEAHELIAHYYMKKLRRAIEQQKGEAVEKAALREVLRYGPQRKEEAYNLFADRCMDELKQALEEHDKEYAKMAMEAFVKYAPWRKAEVTAVWERHMEAAKERKLYGILGIERTATPEEIKLAYRKLAKELHPDIAGDDVTAGERMKHVNAAYTILGDPELRARYDQRGDRRERHSS